MQDSIHSTTGSYPAIAQLLRDSFAIAVAAADPMTILGEHLPEPPAGRVMVVGAGKAAASMARALELAWGSRLALSGLVITRDGHGLPTEHIEVVEAGHPVPDERGASAARQVLALVSNTRAEDLVLVLLSGGGSSLLSLPAPGLDLAALKAVNRELLRSGASIVEMNVVRKHLSAISGGRLAAATRARVLALVVSDVVGDDLSAIASGPCAPDQSTFADALAIVDCYGLDLPAAAMTHLHQGASGQVAETPKRGDAVFVRVEHRIIASAHRSLDAAAAFFRLRGITAVVLGDSVTGEAREVAKVYAALVREVRSHNQPWSAPVALISGGECTVTVRGEGGRGGRCTEFLLALALELEGVAGVHALACDTDGIDGSEDNAGAILSPHSVERAAASGVAARACLENHDAWDFFRAADALVVTGPTRTNVNDYRVILIL